MRTLTLALAVAGALGIGAISGTAQAAPLTGIGTAADAGNVVDQAQYVYGGYRHCWYSSGWQGAGWYRCGYRHRRGYGYGGPVGWNGWAAPGVAVVAPGIAVGVGPYYYRGRHYHNRRYHNGRWRYY